MSKTKSGGKTSQHVNPKGKRLGVKKYTGEKVVAGEVLVRQVGTKIKKGVGVGVARDFTIYALASGLVKFGRKFGRTIVSVVPN